MSAVTCHLILLTTSWLAATATPREAADELRRRLLARGPFRALYEIAMPSTGRTSKVELTAHLPFAACLVSRGGGEEVRAFADAREGMLYVLGREAGRPVLLRTKADRLVETVRRVRLAFIRAGLAEAGDLPEVAAGPDAKQTTARTLRLFATVTLGPARDRRGRPYLRSGTGLAVGAEPDCASWLLEFASADPAALTVTADAFRLRHPGGRLQLVVSRLSGLPTSARTEPEPGRALTLTLERLENLERFKMPAWVGKLPPGVEVREMEVSERQRRRAAFTAWTFYAAEVIRTLAARPDRRAMLDAERDAKVEALSAEAAPLWQDRGGGSPRGFLAVLRGSHLEAARRFRYVKETAPAKLRAVARRYALEAIQRRSGLLEGALDETMSVFEKALPRRSAAASRPAGEGTAEKTVTQAVLALLRRAARASFLERASRLIADELVARREAADR